MEVTRPSSHPRDVLRRIREFTLSIVVDLRNGKLPSIIIDRFQNCCDSSDGYCLCTFDYSKGKEVFALKSQSQAHRLDVLLQVLLIIQKLLQENRHASKRDIYYMNPGLFSEQLVVDKAIYDIGILLQCSRHNLNVGRGYPDVNTRRFLRLLVEKLELPTFCLVDCDPYGFDILTTYRFGSMQMAHDAQFLRVPEIQWLGVFLSESEKYNIPSQCLLPLTAEDSRRTEGILRRCYLQREVTMWRLELEVMLQRGVKFEIEALSVHSISFLSEKYLPSKIHIGAHVS